MSQDKSLIFWTSLMAVTFVTTAWPVHAGNPPATSDGYKTVQVSAGGKTLPIQVREGGDPYKNVSSSNPTGKYDPERIFSAQSSMANKQFSVSSDSPTKSASDFKNRDQNTFVTKAYADNASFPSAADPEAKTSFPTAHASSRNGTGFDKTYPTSSAETGRSRAAVLASATSTDQNRAAVLGSPTVAADASPLAAKTFRGPEADAIHQHLTKTDDGRIFISDLPNRPLTIDEVRNLINHGFKPNTEVKPEESSKPLNDPNYKPVPLRDAPSPLSDDDKNDPVPPPGTMSAPPPENSEPLPQP